MTLSNLPTQGGYYLEVDDASDHSVYYSSTGDWATPTLVSPTAGSTTYISFGSGPAVSVSAPGTYLPGSSVTLDVSVDPAISGNGVLWYRTDGGAWHRASAPVPVVDGVGTKAVSPSGVRQYKVEIEGAVSNVVTLSPALPDVAVTVSAPATYVPGSTVTLDITVDPASSGSGVLWYRTAGGEWHRASAPVDVVAGAAAKVVKPSGVRQYRVEFAGAQSNVVTLSPAAAAPTVTVSAPATYVPGSTATLDITVDPASSGSGVLWYRTDGGAWHRSSAPVDVVDGAATREVKPSGVRDFKVEFAGGESNVVTLSPAAAAPTVTVSAPATYVPGSTATLDITVDSRELGQRGVVVPHRRRGVASRVRTGRCG